MRAAKRIDVVVKNYCSGWTFRDWILYEMQDKASAGTVTLCRAFLFKLGLILPTFAVEKVLGWMMWQVHKYRKIFKSKRAGKNYEGAVETIAIREFVIHRAGKINILEKNLYQILEMVIFTGFLTILNFFHFLPYLVP